MLCSCCCLFIRRCSLRLCLMLLPLLETFDVLALYCCSLLGESRALCAVEGRAEKEDGEEEEGEREEMAGCLHH